MPTGSRSPGSSDCEPSDRPGLSLLKRAEPAQVSPGGLVTYTYTVQNTGNILLTDVMVVDDNGTTGFTDDDVLIGTALRLGAPLSVQRQSESSGTVDGIEIC